MRRWIAAAVLILASCGGGPNTPSAPQIAQIAGVWSGTTRSTTVTGGECVGAAIQSTIGTTNRVTLAITQAGSAINGTLTSQSSGVSCSYTGIAGSAAFTLNAAASCQLVYQLRCPNGALRDMILVADAFTINVAGGSGTGTEAETWTIRNSTTLASVGVLMITSAVSITR